MIQETECFQATVIVGNEMGLHARVATMLAQAMKNFSCKVTLSKDGVEVDARSILGLLLLAATPGSEIILKAHGPDCKLAVTALSRLLQNEHH